MLNASLHHNDSIIRGWLDILLKTRMKSVMLRMIQLCRTPSGNYWFVLFHHSAICVFPWFAAEARLGHRDIGSGLLLNSGRYATRMRMRKEVVELGQTFYL